MLLGLESKIIAFVGCIMAGENVIYSYASVLTHSITTLEGGRNAGKG